MATMAPLFFLSFTAVVSGLSNQYPTIRKPWDQNSMVPGETLVTAVSSNSVNMTLQLGAIPNATKCYDLRYCQSFNVILPAGVKCGNKTTGTTNLYGTAPSYGVLGSTCSPDNMTVTLTLGSQIPYPMNISGAWFKLINLVAGNPPPLCFQPPRIIFATGAPDFYVPVLNSTFKCYESRNTSVTIDSESNQLAGRETNLTISFLYPRNSSGSISPGHRILANDYLRIITPFPGFFVRTLSSGQLPTIDAVCGSPRFFGNMESDREIRVTFMTMCPDSLGLDDVLKFRIANVLLPVTCPAVGSVVQLELRNSAGQTKWRSSTTPPIVSACRDERSGRVRQMNVLIYNHFQRLRDIAATGTPAPQESYGLYTAGNGIEISGQPEGGLGLFSFINVQLPRGFTHNCYLPGTCLVELSGAEGYQVNASIAKHPRSLVDDLRGLSVIIRPKAGVLSSPLQPGSSFSLKITPVSPRDGITTPFNPDPRYGLQDTSGGCFGPVAVETETDVGFIDLPKLKRNMTHVVTGFVGSPVPATCVNGTARPGFLFADMFPRARDLCFQQPLQCFVGMQCTILYGSVTGHPITLWTGTSAPYTNVTTTAGGISFIPQANDWPRLWYKAHNGTVNETVGVIVIDKPCLALSNVTLSTNTSNSSVTISFSIPAPFAPGNNSAIIVSFPDAFSDAVPFVVDDTFPSTSPFHLVVPAGFGNNTLAQVGSPSIGEGGLLDHLDFADDTSRPSGMPVIIIPHKPTGIGYGVFPAGATIALKFENVPNTPSRFNAAEGFSVTVRTSAEVQNIATRFVPLSGQPILPGVPKDLAPGDDSHVSCQSNCELTLDPAIFTRAGASNDSNIIQELSMANGGTMRKPDGADTNVSHCRAKEMSLGGQTTFNGVQLVITQLCSMDASTVNLQTSDTVMQLGSGAALNFNSDSKFQGDGTFHVGDGTAIIGDGVKVTMEAQLQSDSGSIELGDGSELVINNTVAHLPNTCLTGKTGTVVCVGSQITFNAPSGNHSAEANRSNVPALEVFDASSGQGQTHGRRLMNADADAAVISGSGTFGLITFTGVVLLNVDSELQINSTSNITFSSGTTVNITLDADTNSVQHKTRIWADGCIQLSSVMVNINVYADFMPTNANPIVLLPIMHSNTSCISGTLSAHVYDFASSGSEVSYATTLNVTSNYVYLQVTRVPPPTCPDNLVFWTCPESVTAQCAPNPNCGEMMLCPFGEYGLGLSEPELIALGCVME